MVVLESWTTLYVSINCGQKHEKLYEYIRKFNLNDREKKKKPVNE